MNRRAIIATHHKAGTAWMKTTFREIAQRCRIWMVDAKRDGGYGPNECKAPAIIRLRNAQLWKYSGLTEGDDYRVFHLIRDPRDMMISAMHYHREANEKWLIAPRAEYAGLSYQKKLNGLPSDRERFHFEMENTNAVGIVSRWQYGRKHCFECKYEELMDDTEMMLFTQVVSHLGFAEEELEICRSAFWNNSLFGGMAAGQGSGPHIRSGVARQWPGVFDRKLAAEFLARYGSVLIRAGYEKNNSWIDTLPAVSPALDGIVEPMAAAS